ncbi:FecR family protein [Sphingopyxis sp.]|uniref:FecR family protein n=1 Tax=Sphingopyxis sp. TaxID=1908224 RepID=UPI002D76F50B|nr:FecR domain-containing protein [Sphingopyxis sp.]HET6523567.1 FecR domain-containing protein [Sphingopyxis sp.]
MKRLNDFHILIALTFLCLVAAPGLPAAAQGREARGAEVVLYRVKAGDNLYDLAGRYLTRIESHAAVQRLNAISDPRRLRPGSLIRIPRSLLRHEPLRAVVQSYRGTVIVQRGAARQAVAVGMRLGEGDLLETAEKSFVSLRLPDDSTVAMPSHSSVRIQRLRRTLLGGSIDRLFAIVKGRANATVTPMTDPGSRFDMSTPLAVSAVRGTEFRMSFDPGARRTTTEVTEGKVAFEPAIEGSAAPAGAQLVTTGFGIATDLAAPVALLSPPDLLRPGRVQDEDRLRFELRPVDGAVRYHIQVSRDAGFLELLDDAEAAAPLVDLEPLANGTYFVRATAIDARGLEGMPATYGFERRLNRVEASVEGTQAGRHREYLFRWRTPDAPRAQYRFQLFSASAIDPIVDETGLASTTFVVADLPEGSYRWRVMTLKFAEGRPYDSWSTFQELRVDTEK